MGERDTHFQGFAELLYPELTRDFYLLYTYRHANQHAMAEQVIHQIKEHLAQRAYDLAQHVLNGNETLQWKPLEEISVKDIPDLTEWLERS